MGKISKASCLCFSHAWEKYQLLFKSVFNGNEHVHATVPKLCSQRDAFVLFLMDVVGNQHLLGSLDSHSSPYPILNLRQYLRASSYSTFLTVPLPAMLCM